MDKKPLTATMQAALDKAIEHGSLERHPGGFWSFPGCPFNGYSPRWYAGTPTVEALVARGRLEYSEWKDGRNGRFPIAAKVAA